MVHSSIFHRAWIVIVSRPQMSTDVRRQRLPASTRRGWHRLTRVHARTKNGHPPKTCERCQRPFEWRKKWARDWAQVRYCSEACRRGTQVQVRPGLPVDTHRIRLGYRSA